MGSSWAAKARFEEANTKTKLTALCQKWKIQKSSSTPASNPWQGSQKQLTPQTAESLLKAPKMTLKLESSACNLSIPRSSSPFPASTSTAGKCNGEHNWTASPRDGLFHQKGSRSAWLQHHCTACSTGKGTAATELRQYK